MVLNQKWFFTKNVRFSKKLVFTKKWVLAQNPGFYRNDGFDQKHGFLNFGAPRSEGRTIFRNSHFRGRYGDKVSRLKCTTLKMTYFVAICDPVLPGFCLVFTGFSGNYAPETCCHFSVFKKSHQKMRVFSFQKRVRHLGTTFSCRHGSKIIFHF